MTATTEHFFCLILLLLMTVHYLVDHCDAGLVELDDMANRYVEIGLNNEKICNPISTKIESVTELRKFKDSAILVKPFHVFDSRQIKYSKYCKFKIKGPKGDNLFAVVQRMSLRLNENQTQCLDYVSFEPEQSFISRRSPKKYCGKITPDEVAIYTSESNQTDLKRIEEFSPAGKIITEVYISKQPLKTGESLDLIIVYTPYKDCNKVEDPADVWSDPEKPQMCISKKFVCDGYVNCASLICNDEGHNCTIIKKEIVSNEIGTKVTISAVTTMILCFIMCMMCFWICKKHKIFCWSQDCAGPSTASRNTSNMPMERGDSSVATPPYISSAPMLEVAVPSSVNDKDLPPSYESLFPLQATAANT